MLDNNLCFTEDTWRNRLKAVRTAVWCAIKRNLAFQCTISWYSPALLSASCSGSPSRWGTPLSAAHTASFCACILLLPPCESISTQATHHIHWFLSALRPPAHTHVSVFNMWDDTTMSPYSTVAWHCVKSLFATLGQIICTRQSLYCVTLNLRCYSVLWLYRTFKALSSSMSVLFCFSRTATRFSRHLTYSFFFRRHSRAASLEATTERLCKQESILYSVYRSHCLRHHQSKRTC